MRADLGFTLRARAIVRTDQRRDHFVTCIHLEYRSERMIAGNHIRISRIVLRALPVFEGVAISGRRLHDGYHITFVCIDNYLAGLSIQCTAVKIVSDLMRDVIPLSVKHLVFGNFRIKIISFS